MINKKLTNQLAKKVNLEPLERNHSKSTIQIFFYFLIVSFLLRFPFFFKDVISSDESTFILVGQSVLDGYLLYTDLWDLKPPLLPVSFALFIAIFGKSIASVRFAGTLCVTLVAWFTYTTGKSVWTARIGLIGGTLFIVLVSLFPSGQSVMSEHIALVPMMGAIALLSELNPESRQIFLVGALMTTSSMVRLNLAYVTMFVGIFMAFSASFKERSLSSISSLVILKGLTYLLGAVLIIFLTALPFVVKGHVSTLWKSAIMAPLAYASSQLSWVEAVAANIKNIWLMIFDQYGSFMLASSIDLAVISILVWIGGMFGLGVVIKRWRKSSTWEQRGVILLAFLFVSITFSIVQSGGAFKHYLIQLIPISALFSAVGISFLFQKSNRWIVLIALILITGVSTTTALENYQMLWARASAGSSLNYGSAYKIADYLNQVNLDKKPIYMMTNHIVYWLIGEKPLSKSTTHPSNIGKEYLLNVVVGPGTTVKQELTRVLDQKPEFIVTQKKIWYLQEHDDARALFNKVLKTKYTLVKRIDGKQIYQRHNP